MAAGAPLPTPAASSGAKRHCPSTIAAPAPRVVVPEPSLVAPTDELADRWHDP